MFRKYHHFRRTLPVTTGILFLALICFVFPLLIACDSEEQGKYPWLSVIAYKGYLPPNMKVDGYYLEIYFDLGKEVTTDEAAALRDEVTLQDKNGKAYEPMSYRTTGSVLYTATTDAEGNNWSAEHAFGLGFVVESDTMDFTLVWSGYPPVDIGNPFETTFVMESE